MATVAGAGKGSGDVGSIDVRAQSNSIPGRQALPVQTVPSGEPVSSLTARRGAEKAAYGAPGDVVSMHTSLGGAGDARSGARQVDHLFYITLVDRSISRKLGWDGSSPCSSAPPSRRHVWLGCSRQSAGRVRRGQRRLDHWVSFGSTAASANGADKWSFSVAARCSCAPSSGLVER